MVRTSDRLMKVAQHRFLASVQYTLSGIHVINVRKTWEKLLLAARAIAAIENPADVCVVSARPYAQRALLKVGFSSSSVECVVILLLFPTRK